MLVPLDVHVLRGPAALDAAHVHVYVPRGECRLAGGDVLREGDALRATGAVTVVRADEALATLER
jgi:hypothetical protein